MQIEKLERLALLMPRDVMQSQFGFEAETAQRIAGDAAETRRRFLSTLMLCEQLQIQGISGRDYLDTAMAEQDQPLLILPHVHHG